jgi:hypothetical protein
LVTERDYLILCLAEEAAEIAEVCQRVVVRATKGAPVRVGGGPAGPGP